MSLVFVCLFNLQPYWAYFGPFYRWSAVAALVSFRLHVARESTYTIATCTFNVLLDTSGESKSTYVYIHSSHQAVRCPHNLNEKAAYKSTLPGTNFN